eukprot:scaffold211165_cov30-Tisochrysis_lutea.AAC.4
MRPLEEGIKRAIGRWPMRTYGTATGSASLRLPANRCRVRESQAFSSSRSAARRPGSTWWMRAGHVYGCCARAVGHFAQAMSGHAPRRALEPLDF